MTDEKLINLLEKSRLKNGRLDVTGMLLYLDPFFIQILEGEETVVNQVFNVIKQDPKHYKVSIRYKKPIDDRSFANWTMGFNKPNVENLVAIDGFSDFWKRPISDFFNAPNSETREILERFLDMFKHETLF